MQSKEPESLKKFSLSDCGLIFLPAHVTREVIQCSQSCCDVIAIFSLLVYLALGLGLKIQGLEGVTGASNSQMLLSNGWSLMRKYDYSDHT